MKVSIIVPNYNHEKYLDERIQSILNQTYQDFEIIILDDCSTDNSKFVIEKFRNNEHVSHIVYNEQNSGSTFKQWERGFELAKGELIWIAESDDSCDYHFLDNLVPNFNDSRLVLAFSRSMQFDDDEELGVYPTQIKMDNSFRMSGQLFIKKYLSYRNIVVNASSAIIRKSVINKINNDYYSYKGCGDWLFWIYIAEQGDVCYSSECLNLFRQHVTNTTNKLDKSGNNPKEVHKIYKYLVQKNYLDYFNRKKFRASRLSYYLSSSQFDPEVKKKVLNEWDFSLVDYLLSFILNYYRKIKR